MGGATSAKTRAKIKLTKGRKTRAGRSRGAESREEFQREFPTHADEGNQSAGCSMLGAGRDAAGLHPSLAASACPS